MSSVALLLTVMSVFLVDSTIHDITVSKCRSSKSAWFGDV